MHTALGEVFIPGSFNQCDILLHDLRELTKWLCAVFALILAVIGSAHAHWPGQPEHQMAQLGDLKLESGEVIKNFRMSYVTHGKLNAAKDNAILFIHGFAANHHLFDHMIGPGRPLDTDKYFVICPDMLGATQTGYEHTTSPTNSGLKMKFPFYSERDMVNAQYRLITESLGIPHLLGVTGISSGGTQSVQFAVSYPHFMDGIFPVVGLVAGGTHGRLWGPLMASVITSCKGWDDGNYEVNPRTCAINAMSILTNRFYSDEWWHQYVDTAEAYTKWRSTFGEYYIDVQDTRDLFYRIVSGGRGWVGNSPGFGEDLAKVLGSIKAAALVIYATHDQIFRAADIEAQTRMIPGARALPLDSVAGHLVCCNADPQATRQMGNAIRAFLQELAAQRMSAK